MAKQTGFNDIFEELTWEMCKLSDGNPYILQDLVRERNLIREKKEMIKE